MKPSDSFPFLLCQIEPPQNTDGGDYYYRTYAPGLTLAKEKGVFVVNLTNEHREKWTVAGQADVLVLKNICDPDFLPLIRQRKDQGKVTVYEIADDLSAIEPWNPVHFFYKEPENQSLAWRLASFCDALQVTCPHLQKLYGHLNPICRVFPNHISYVPPERIYRKKNGSVIGWGGSHGHLQDMAEIAEPLSRWLNQEPELSLDLMASEPIQELFKGILKEKRKFFPTGSIERYHAFLRHIDVGIGPLKDTPFNRSRSDVKFLEYAVTGVVPVMKRLEPYTDSIKQGETGFLYEDTRDLMEILSLLRRDPILVERIGRAARSYVLQHRLEADHAAERAQFYRGLLEKASGGCESRHPGGKAQLLANMDGAVIRGRHIRLESTRFEMLLYEGLVAMQIMKDREASYRLFQRASAMEPANYLPYLYGAPVSPNPIETLMKAAELNPRSLKARIMLGDLMAQHGDLLEALRWLNGAAEIFPGYEIPYSKAASLLEQAGQPEQANVLSEKAASLFVQTMHSAGAAEGFPAI